jgi:hypothetical protein
VTMVWLQQLPSSLISFLQPLAHLLPRTSAVRGTVLACVLLFYSQPRRLATQWHTVESAARAAGGPCSSSTGKSLLACFGTEEALKQT